MFVNSTSACLDGAKIRLENGTVRDGTLFDSRGRRVEAERPLQVFTRWYGFALTFPTTSIYSRP